MTQPRRSIVEMVLIAASMLCVVVFVVQHFMTLPRPSWHRDVAWLALAFVCGAELVRGRVRRRARRVGAP